MTVALKTMVLLNMNSFMPSVSRMSIKGPIGELLRVVVVNSDRTEKLLAHDKLYRKSNAVSRFSPLRNKFVIVADMAGSGCKKEGTFSPEAS